MKKTKDEIKKEQETLNEKLQHFNKFIKQGYSEYPIIIQTKHSIDVANDFKTVAIMIYDNNLSNDSIKNKLLNPFVMNAMFSIEIYLKIIIKSINSSVDNVHNLKKLFETIKNDRNDIYYELNNTYIVKVNKDLSYFADEYQNAFENFRYSYEGYNYDGSIDCSKIMLHFSPDDIVPLLVILSEFCNENCKEVSFCD